ncbi:MAG: hypothetical protein Q9217_001074 [Psora testacea]
MGSVLDLEDPPRSLHTDEAVRVRIHQRYLRYYGERYADTILNMLPRSIVFLLTYGNVASRNTIVDDCGHITGVVDWELAGWRPDYWVYMSIMRPSQEENWQSRMDPIAIQR